MKFIDPAIKDKLTEEQVAYVDLAVNEIILKSNIRGVSQQRKLRKTLTLLLSNLEYRDAHKEDGKEKAYVRNYYKKDNTKENIKEHYKNKKALIVIPRKSDFILANKESWGLADVGKGTIIKAIDLLHKYAICEIAIGNKALTPEGKAKRLIDTTDLNEYVSREEYYDMLYGSAGYMTTLTYRPREIHMIDGMDHYENAEKMAIINDKVNGTRRFASKHKQSRLSKINSFSRNIKLSHLGHDMRYTEIYTNDEIHNGRLHNSLQNIPKATRNKYLTASGFDTEIDVPNAKFGIFSKLAGETVEGDAYISVGLAMGYSMEFCIQHRHVFKEAMQPMLQPMTELKRKLAVQSIFAKHGMMISNKKYVNNTNTQFSFLNKEDLITAINNKDYSYAIKIKDTVESIMKDKPKRIISGKIRTLYRQFLKGEDFYYDDNQTIIVNRNAKNKIESFTIYYNNGNVEEFQPTGLAQIYYEKQALSTFHKIFYYRKEHNITVPYQEIDPQEYINTFISLYPAISKVVESTEIDYLYLESETTLNILEDLLPKGIEVINIHDAFVCNDKDKEIVEEVINYHYEKGIFQVISDLLSKMSNKTIVDFIMNKIKGIIGDVQKEVTQRNNPCYRDRNERWISGMLIDEYGEIVMDCT